MGSSRTSTAGSPRSAVARESRWRMPREKPPTRRPAASVRPTRSSAASTPSVPTPSRRAPGGGRRRCGTGGPRPRRGPPRRSRPGRSRSAYGTPLDGAVPASGRTRPSRARRVVVLPAPLGPRNPVIGAGVDREGQVVDRGDASEALREPVDLDGVHGRMVGPPRAPVSSHLPARSPISPAAERALRPGGDEPRLVRDHTSWPRSRAPSLARIRPTWVLAVAWLTWMRSPISALDRPRATRPSTSVSRSVSRRGARSESRPARCAGPPANRSMRRRVTLGAEQGVARGHHPDGVHEALRGHVLEQEPARARLQGAVDVLVEVEGGEDDAPGRPPGRRRR